MLDGVNFKTVDQYLDTISPEQLTFILPLRNLILSLVPPNTTETISYNMPAYKYKGKILVYFMSFKKHYSFFPTGIVENYKEQLKAYKISKGTLQINYGQQLPAEVIKSMIEYRVKVVDEKSKK